MFLFYYSVYANSFISFHVNAKRLYRNYPTFFLQSSFSKKRVMDSELTTNTKIVFDLEEVNFKDYSDAIIDLWKEFPEHLSGKYTFPD